MSERASLGLDENEKSEDSIDLQIFTELSEEIAPINHDMKNALAKGGEKLGFTSREQRRPVKRRSPYTIQSNMKMRPGMKELFQEVSARMVLYDQETLEYAILALLEKEDYSDLLDEFHGLFKKDSS